VSAAFLKHIFSRVSGSSHNIDEGSANEAKMIVGLGNPGKRYAGTRHNAGFEVVDEVASLLDAVIKKKKFGGLFVECLSQGGKLILLKPQQYMNCSGQVVATAMGFYKLSVNNIIVATDDMALEPGRIRIRSKGSSGGHNGLADIIQKLGTDEFSRLRVGIGKNDRVVDRDHVLSRPSAEDRQLIRQTVETSARAVLCWAEEGVDMAMNKFNVRNNE